MTVKIFLEHDGKTYFYQGELVDDSDPTFITIQDVKKGLVKLNKNKILEIFQEEENEIKDD